MRPLKRLATCRDNEDVLGGREGQGAGALACIFAAVGLIPLEASDRMNARAGFLTIRLHKVRASGAITLRCYRRPWVVDAVCCDTDNATEGASAMGFAVNCRQRRPACG